MTNIPHYISLFIESDVPLVLNDLSAIYIMERFQDIHRFQHLFMCAVKTERSFKSFRFRFVWFQLKVIQAIAGMCVYFICILHSWVVLGILWCTQISWNPVFRM